MYFLLEDRILLVWPYTLHMTLYQTRKGPDYKKKMHKYVKQKINKNGITLKRPNIRPKHLIDCLKDPVHYEFFHRFAKAKIFTFKSDLSRQQSVCLNQFSLKIIESIFILTNRFDFGEMLKQSKTSLHLLGLLKFKMVISHFLKKLI